MPAAKVKEPMEMEGAPEELRRTPEGVRGVDFELSGTTVGSAKDSRKTKSSVNKIVICIIKHAYN